LINCQVSENVDFSSADFSKGDLFPNRRDHTFLLISAIGECWWLENKCRSSLDWDSLQSLSIHWTRWHVPSVSAWRAWDEGARRAQIKFLLHVTRYEVIRQWTTSGMHAVLSHEEAQKVMTVDARPEQSRASPLLRLWNQHVVWANTGWSTIGSLSKDVSLADLAPLNGSF
jgi:hypothetical protein